MHKLRLYKQPMGTLGEWKHELHVELPPNGHEDVPIQSKEVTMFELDVDVGATKKQKKSIIRSAKVQGHNRFGFDHIDFNPIRLEEGQTTISTARMKAYFLDWVYNYITEAPDFESPFIWAQCVFRQQQAATTRLPPHNPLTLAICCTMLEHLVPSFGALAPLLRILLTELFNTLYEGYHVVNDLSMDVLDPDQLLLAFTTSPAQPHEPLGKGLGDGRCILDLTLYADLQDSCREEYLETKEMCKYFKMDCNKVLVAQRAGIKVFTDELQRLYLHGWHARASGFCIYELWLKVYQRKRERILKRNCLLAWHWAARQTVVDTYPEAFGQEMDKQNELAQLERESLEADIRQLEQENAHLEEMLRQKEEEDVLKHQYMEYLEQAALFEKKEQQAEALEDEIHGLNVETHQMMLEMAKIKSIFEMFRGFVNEGLITFALGCPSNVQGERGSPIVLLQSLQCTKPRPMPSELALFRPYLDLRVNPRFLVAEDAEVLLLHWINSLLASRPIFEGKYSPAGNFGPDMWDSFHLTHLLHAVWPLRCSVDLLEKPDVEERAAAIVECCAGLGLHVITQPEDITQGNAPLNFLLVYQIFEYFTECCRLDYAHELDEGVYRFVPQVVEPESEVLERYMNVFTAVNDENPSWALLLNHIWARGLGLVTEQIQQQLPPEEFIHPRFCQDTVLYANPRPETLGELLPSDSALWPQVIESLKQAQMDHYQTVKAMYQFYSTLSNQTPGLSWITWQKFLEDTNLSQHKRFQPPAPSLQRSQDRGMGHTIFQQCTGRDERMADGMGPKGFSAALVWVAHHFYQDGCERLAEQFRQLLVDHLIPWASRSHADPFKQYMLTAPLQAMLKRHHKQLQKIFHFYSAGQREENKEFPMLLKDFAILWKDCDMIDRALSRNDISTVFSCCQNVKEDGEATEMDFDEFRTAVCAVGLMRNPSPFVPDAIKLENFLAKQFFPPLLKKYSRLKMQ